MSKSAFKAALAEYAAASAEDRPPDFGRFEFALWAKAADALVQRGELELAAVAVRRLGAQWPAFEWAGNVDRMLTMAPPADPATPPIVDNFPEPIQVVGRPGADTALLVFCGATHRPGLPLPILHRWLARLPVSLIYLRDRKSFGYLGGLEPLGADRAATVDSLRRTIGELGARRIVCYGPSIGGYGALRYGLELGAAATVLFSGIVNMDPGFNLGLHYVRTAHKLQAAFPGEILDLRELYLASARPPAVFAAYAQHNWDDRLHAEYLAELDGVVAVQAAGAKTHNTTLELMRRGRFDALMRDVIAAEGPAR